jgi:uncharacterized protein
MLAVTIHSPVETDEGIEIARQLARQVGFRHKVVAYDDLENPLFRSNPIDRCYHCKLARFQFAKKMADAEGFQWVAEGSNASDIDDYRPGMRAVKELGIRSPLLEVGLIKDDIRKISKALGLILWDRPSSPCLATRFPYGMEVTREGIKKIREGEEFLKSIGYTQLRVRYHGSLARIEVPASSMDQIVKDRLKIVSYFKQIGFTFVSVDLTGFRSGSMNEEIKT